MADKNHRGFYSSFQYVTLIGGQICALLVLLLLQNVFLTNEEIRAWGWRIPFVIGALLAVIALVMRRNLHETDAFEAAKKTVRGTSPLRTLMKYPREVLLVAGLTAGGTAAFYTYHVHEEISEALGRSERQCDHNSDLERPGVWDRAPADLRCDLRPRRQEVAAHRVWRDGVLFTIPILTALQSASGPLMAFLLIAAAWMIVSGYTSINAVVKAELFPTSVRALGVGLPYALTVSIFGGTADSAALWFKSIGHEDWFYYYLTGMIGISLIVYLFMCDTKADSAMQRHH
jgi:MHS family alpha-ketoglutarate permease-like MFS transporter